MDEKIKLKILNAAIQAPSGDNSQPWQFHWDNNSLDLWIDKSRSGKMSDSNLFLSDMAVGACLTNIRIAAESSGLHVSIALFPEKSVNPLYAARLTFSENNGTQNVLFNEIERRHTNRTFPWKDFDTPQTKQALDCVTDKHSETEILWFYEKNERKKAIRLLHKAEAMRFRYQALHQELFSSIRFEEGWQSIAEEGLSPATLSVEPFLRMMFKALSNWKLMSLYNKIGGHQIMAFRAASLPARLSPVLGAISVTSISRTNIILAGSLLEQLWLTASKMGLAFQPFAAIGAISLMTANALQNDANFLSQRSRLNEYMTTLTNDKILLFFRIGIANKRAVPRSGRRKQFSFMKTS